MKINTIKYDYSAHNRLSADNTRPHSGFKEKCSAGVCKSENSNGEYSVTFSGSGPESNGATAKSFFGSIKHNVMKGFDWLAEFSGKHNVAAASLVSLFLAGMLRPAITVALPGKKDKDDKIYAAGHSMASGLIGYVASTILTTPLDTGLAYIIEDAKKLSPEALAKMSEEELEEYKFRHGGKAEVRTLKKGLTIVSDKVDKINELRHQLYLTKNLSLHSKILELEKNVSGIHTTAKNVSEWAIAIPRAMLTIALIPPILKYIFHVEKKNKVAKQVEQAPTTTTQEQTPQQNLKASRPMIDKFLGGNK